MKSRMIIYSAILVSVAALYVGCKSSTTASDVEVSVSGKVYDSSGTALAGATVWDKGSYASSTTSGSDGAYTLSLTSRPSSDIFYASHTGYYPDTEKLTFTSSQTSASVSFHLRRNSTVSVTDTSAASQITLVSVTPTSLDIAGTGGTEASVLKYEILDAMGNAVTGSTHTYAATFKLVFVPNNLNSTGTSPWLVSENVTSDTSGNIQATVRSGTEAGVVQVIATITLDSTTVTTKPVEITVNAGYPDQNHFSISPSQYVFADDQSTSGTATFTISAADKYSNPVKPGTAIYCNTQAGKITVPDGGTDANGFATATLFTFAPTPFTSSFCDESVADYVNGGTVGRVGYEWVYAHTVGENSETVKDSVCVLWSVAPIKIAFDGGTVSTAPTRPTITLVSHGSSISHTIRIVDSYGNPLPAFTKISVAVEYDESIYDGLKFSVGGDLSTTIPNAAYARFLQEGISDFVFEVSDNSKSDFTGSVTLVITVTSTIETLSISIPVTVTATP